MKNFLVFVLALFAVSASAHAANPREELKQLTAQLQSNPADTALREKVVKLARTMKPAPALPEEAEKYEGRAIFAFKNAKSTDDYADAAKEYEKAVQAAPWIPGYYSDLCTIYEKAGKYVDAKRNCEIYVRTLSDPRKISETKQRIAGLEYGIEKANSPEAQAAKKREQEEALVRTLDGAIYRYEMRDGGGTLLSRSTITIHGNRVTVTEQGLGPYAEEGTTTNSCVLDSLRCEWPNPPPYIAGTIIIELSTDGRQATKKFRLANGQMSMDDRVHVRQ